MVFRRKANLLFLKNATRKLSVNICFFNAIHSQFIVFLSDSHFRSQFIVCNLILLILIFLPQTLHGKKSQSHTRTIKMAKISSDEKIAILKKKIASDEKIAIIQMASVRKIAIIQIIAIIFGSFTVCFTAVNTADIICKAIILSKANRTDQEVFLD